MQLKVDDLSCVRGGRRVFAGLSFSVESGAMMTLRGPNGSGKSTLLRALSGLTPIERGSVRLDERALADDRDAVQERILFCGHLDAVKPGLTVLENLRFWAAFHGAAKREATARAVVALQAVDLAHIADAPAGFCSAGQRRRLGLARLGVVDRPLWLLDEPTVSLDAESVATLGAMIAAHCARGGMVVAATHIDLPAAEVGVLSMDAYRPAGGDLGDPFLDGADWAGA